MVKDPEVVVLHDILGIFPSFQELTPWELDRIITFGRLVTSSKGAMLFVEGDPGEALYIVVDGSVRIGKNVPGAKEEAMAFIERGVASARWPCSMNSPGRPRPSRTRSAGSCSSRN